MQPSPTLETCGPLEPSLVVICVLASACSQVNPVACDVRACKPATVEGVAPERAKPRSMTEHEASRTLVKSPPELWAECSDAASLARHLGQFGDIRITRLEPETAVAWEGEGASGTVKLEPSGWGTRVILTAVQARIAGEGEPPEAVADEGQPPPESAAPVQASTERPRVGLLTRLRMLLGGNGGRTPAAQP